MQTKNSDMPIYLLALWLMCSSANGEYFCESYKLGAPLGSSVLLPCIFSSKSHSWVQWAHDGAMDLVNISSDGRLKFLNHRYGRVKAFPNQASKQNYSICISELQLSDLGFYRCIHGRDCRQVELVQVKSTPSDDMWFLIYICVGVAILFLLGLSGYVFFMEHKRLCHRGTKENANIHVTAGAANCDLVYENEDQQVTNADPPRHLTGMPQGPQHPDWSQPAQSSTSLHPNVAELKFERTESKRTRQRFHLEIISRIRQASVNRHFYVNQSEISKQQAIAAQVGNQRAGQERKKATGDSEYQNPIYNRSTEQLNQLWTPNNRC